ncbi:MAG: hypothetical protein J7M40_03100 [Planctomycetes bacterium]|nr:hypothetical protein [Planctomycetota bacterium]
MKPKGVLEWIPRLIVIGVVLFIITTIGVYAWFFKEVSKVSIASYPLPAEPGEVIFLRTGGLFTDMYLVVNPTPDTEGGELIVGRIVQGDGYHFYDASLSKDGTVIAARTGARGDNLSRTEQGGQFPFTHAYDFKNQTVIAPAYKESSEATKPWNDRAIQILQLLQKRGGAVHFIDSQHLYFKQLSYFRSRRWNRMISEYKQR